MKRKVLMALAATLIATATAAQEKPVFTTLMENPITSVKNQSRSGTCWDYATLGFFEGEILKKTGRTVDLCEMFVANKNYMDEAIFHVRMHGDSRFSEGGSADDVLWVLRTHGICPEDAMPAPGSLTGDELANFHEFFPLLTPYVEAVAKSDAKKLSKQWQGGLQAILDAYLGECPERFSYEGKEYTPRSFADSFGLCWDDYISLTSYQHHPYHEWFIIEAPYKWRPQPSYNLPQDELLRLLDTALDNGYNVCWGGDVSGNGFTRQGLAQEATEPSPDVRQQRFDEWESTYDHVMLIFGKAVDQNGTEYYKVKNSWGTFGDYDGIWYMQKNYIAMNTFYLFLNRNAVPELQTATTTLPVELRAGKDTTMTVGGHIPLSWDHARARLSLGKSATAPREEQLHIRWTDLGKEGTINYTGEATTKNFAHTFTSR